MVEIRWLVLKLKLSQVTDVAQKENLEPVADQVTMTRQVNCWSYILYSSNTWEKMGIHQDRASSIDSVRRNILCNTVI